MFFMYFVWMKYNKIIIPSIYLGCIILFGLSELKEEEKGKLVSVFENIYGGEIGMGL